MLLFRISQSSTIEIKLILFNKSVQTQDEKWLLQEQITAFWPCLSRKTAQEKSRSQTEFANGAFPHLLQHVREDLRKNANRGEARSDSSESSSSFQQLMIQEPQRSSCVTTLRVPLSYASTGHVKTEESKP